MDEKLLARLQADLEHGTGRGPDAFKEAVERIRALAESDEPCLESLLAMRIAFKLTSPLPRSIQ